MFCYFLCILVYFFVYYCIFLFPHNAVVPYYHTAMCSIAQGPQGLPGPPGGLNASAKDDIWDIVLNVTRRKGIKVSLYSLNFIRACFPVFKWSFLKDSLDGNGLFACVLARSVKKSKVSHKCGISEKDLCEISCGTSLSQLNIDVHVFRPNFQFYS